jgi:hypothetical protein
MNNHLKVKIMTFQDGWREDQVHGVMMEAYEQQKRFVIINGLGAKLSRDGNQFCFIVGDMPEHTVVGFGETVAKAAIDFEHNYYNSIAVAPRTA